MYTNQLHIAKLRATHVAMRLLCPRAHAYTYYLTLDVTLIVVLSPGTCAVYTFDAIHSLPNTSPKDWAQRVGVLAGACEGLGPAHTHTSYRTLAATRVRLIVIQSPAHPQPCTLIAIFNYTPISMPYR
jgi:hypothetical protein